MTSVALIGGSGFVGSAIADSLRARGARVTVLAAPRLHTPSRTGQELLGAVAALTKSAEAVDLSQALDGFDVVVNAAGVADATGGGNELFGANALLPGLVGLAAPASARVIHVSSAAVQGRRPVLDESHEQAPFSDYSMAKALGEQAIHGVRPDAVVFRPTSVQGMDRRVTQQLARLARSPMSSVAGRGERPTPQVLVENVADAVAFVALSVEVPPAVVLQPAEGLTTASLLETLGGRRPLQVPEVLARAVLTLLFAVGSRVTRVAGITRRVEMLWFGQEQEEGWLAGRWTAPVGIERWKEIA